MLLNQGSSGLAVRRSLFALSLLAATGSANALGVGRPLTQSALGQPLNLLFPVRLSADETLTPDCVRADVMAGDARVPSGLVQLLLEGEGDASVRGVRLQSTMSIDEPIVTLSLSLGCPTRFTRLYTAFIDPPDARIAAPSFAALLAPVLDGPSLPPASIAQVTPATLAAAEVAPRNYSPALRAALTSTATKPGVLPTAIRTAPTMASAASRPPAPPVAKAPKPKAEPKQRRDATAKAPKQTPSPDATSPRLRLDTPERVESASLVASAAALSATVLQPEMLLTLAQLEALGQSLTKVQQDQRDTERRLLAMRAELAQAQALQSKSALGLAWLQAVLAAAVLGLAGACLYLWRSRRQERLLRDQQWWASGQAAAATPEGAASQHETPDATQRPFKRPRSSGPTPGLGPLVPRADNAFIASPDAESRPVETAAAAVIDTSPAPFGLQDEARSVASNSHFSDSGVATSVAPHSASLGLPVPVAAPLAIGEGPGRQVTVEELIDLEQQVDFFVVLGQDEAAIDLLQTRINTGHVNALPYLKLLELHQRRIDPVAFADLAKRFGARFGTLPPTWDTSLSEGQDLESYTPVMERLLAQWSDSTDSMALLRDLLSYGDASPGEAGLGFDLPAYRDLLMLYGVARDRSDHELRSDEIYLFLPLDDVNEEGAALMSTMVWQVQPTPVASGLAEVDISLGDAPRKR